MRYEEILNRLGPCGLSCEKCFAFIDGSIKKHSVELKKNLGNFDIYAERFVTLVGDPVFEKYPEFKEMLAYFSEVDCKGCRKENCKLFKGCNVRPCSEDKKVDYCFQCSEFPCKKHGFDEHLEKRWLIIQNRMKENSVERYYEETRDISRY